MLKVLLAIDSYKGCLSSGEVEQAVEEGILQVLPACQVVSLPIADGGEGLLDVLVEATQGSYISLEAHDPLMNLIPTRYGLLGDRQTVVIESACISGLPLVPEPLRNPMETTTYGIGELILDALQRGYRKFLVGIGGSATNDAGVGMLQALGCRFYDSNGQALGIGGKQLSKISQIDTGGMHPMLKNAQFTVACDVSNPLYGPEGAAYVFAPQKGASPEDVEQLDLGLRRFAQVTFQTTGKAIGQLPGAGAAGGLGGAFSAFLSASLKSGIEIVLDALEIDKHLAGAQFVITGEGHSDAQTLMGKVPAGVLKRAQQAGIPALLLSGGIEDGEALNRAGFQAVFSTTPCPMPLEKAVRPDIARANIRHAAAQIVRLYAICPGSDAANSHRLGCQSDAEREK